MGKVIAVCAVVLAGVTASLLVADNQKQRRLRKEAEDLLREEKVQGEYWFKRSEEIEASFNDVCSKCHAEVMWMWEKAESLKKRLRDENLMLREEWLGDLFKEMEEALKS